MKAGALCLALFVLTAAGQMAFAAQSIVVGSKIFTEGYVLGEIAAQTVEASSQRFHVIFASLLLT